MEKSKNTIQLITNIRELRNDLVPIVNFLKPIFINRWITLSMTAMEMADLLLFNSEFYLSEGCSTVPRIHLKGLTIPEELSRGQYANGTEISREELLFILNSLANFMIKISTIAQISEQCKDLTNHQEILLNKNLMRVIEKLDEACLWINAHCEHQFDKITTNKN